MVEECRHAASALQRCDLPFVIASEDIPNMAKNLGSLEFQQCTIYGCFICD